MISVCIPVFNFNITELFKGLHEQLVVTKKHFEFVIIDDGSQEMFKKENRIVKEFSNVNYIELDKNLGRSKIRNLLVKEAKYEHLLIMDCDSQLTSDSFISKYLHYCKGETIVCGGCSYQKEKPRNKKNILRWSYGSKRECHSAAIRQINPNHSFTTYNFLISKSIFKQIQFDESLVEYGHEDTLFGYELYIMGIKIRHIDNPLIHIGLETNQEFINKTQQGISNLIKIVEKYPYEMLWESITLLRFYRKIKKLKLKWFFKAIYFLFNRIMIANLKSSNPSVRLFDLYKISYMASI